MASARAVEPLVDCQAGNAPGNSIVVRIKKLHLGLRLPGGADGELWDGGPSEGQPVARIPQISASAAKEKVVVRGIQTDRAHAGIGNV